MNNLTKPKFDGSVRMSPVSVSDWQTRLTPGGKPMYQPRENMGGFCWSQDAVDELLAMIAAGKMMKEIAEAFGVVPAHIRSKLRRLRGKGCFVKSPRTIKYDAIRKRLVVLAPHAKSFTEIAQRLGCSINFVVDTMKAVAPEHHARISRPECGPKPAPEPAEPKGTDWTSRAHALFPGDEALARSLARAASFVAKTRDGITVRIVPPRSEGAAA